MVVSMAIDVELVSGGKSVTAGGGDGCWDTCWSDGDDSIFSIFYIITFAEIPVTPTIMASVQ